MPKRPEKGEAMTKGFVASNGWYIDEDVMHDHVGHDRYTDEVAQMRQFFLEERDHELGRWRDKEFPNLVCYSRGLNYVRVASEKSGEYWEFERDEIDGYSRSEQVARAYFAAHPQNKPLPTEDGLYVSELTRSTLWAARVYRLRDGEWSDVGRPESDPEVVCVAVQEMHDGEGLVPLRIVESEDGE